MTELGNLTAPSAHDGFRDELWQRIEKDERTRRRRRRALGLLAAGAALAALSAAGVLALGSESGGVVDRTLRCPVPEQGGVNVFNLFARVKGQEPAAVGIDAGPLLSPLAAAGSFYKDGSVFDHTACAPTRSIPATRSGIPLADTFRGAQGAGGTRECWVATTITVRLRVKIARGGVPTSAQLAVRSGARQRPVAFVDWTPTLIHVYVTPACHASS
jgi:hypothetical protein